MEKLRTLLGIAIGIDAPVAADLISQAVDIVVYLHQDRVTGKRLVMSIREVTGHEGSQVLTNAVFTRHPGWAAPGNGCRIGAAAGSARVAGFDPRRMVAGVAS